MPWLAVAFEVGKGLWSIISEAVNADKATRDQLGVRCRELFQAGADALAAARAGSAAEDAQTALERAAALGRIRAASQPPVTAPPDIASEK